MAPENPKPNFDFIMHETKPQKRSLLPGGRPIVLLGAALIIILLLILVAGVALGGKGNKGSKSLVDPLGQAQEISRITTEQQAGLKDPAVIALAATSQATLGSEEAQITSYLTAHKVKLDKKKMAVYQANDQSAEAALASAAQENKLDQAYVSYLKLALSRYAASLKTAYGSLSDSASKTLVQNAYASTQTLLSSSLLQ